MVSVEVSPATAELNALDATVQLTAEGFDENGHAVAGAEFLWSSSDAAVATVDASGLVTGVAMGVATITASAGSGQGTAEITVIDLDRAALIALYEATDGPNWVNSDNWLTDAPLWDWYGVRTDASGRVVGLNLAGKTDDWPEVTPHGLEGPIPVELRFLEHLTHLLLSHNALTGPIPAELGSLERLTRLELSHNGLTGPIPPELSNLTRMEKLQLQFASIAGELCVPANAGLVSWLGNFSQAPGAPGYSFLPCERTAPTPSAGPSVRVLYAIPADREFSQEYSDGIRRGVEMLQWWVADWMGGPTFALHDPEPEVCHMTEPESFYVEDAWTRVFHGVQHCAPVGYAGDEHTWVVYADVWDSQPLDVVLATTNPEDCLGGRLGAGTLGLTMMGGWDLYGLATPGFRQCGYETGVDRWIGGLGHELGHALGLPHPPGCDDGSQPCDVHALMYLGYASWPHTYLRDDDMAVLRASPFIR